MFFIFEKGYDKDAVVVYQLDNGAEIEFIDGECVAVVLQSFVAKLNSGNIKSVELESFDIIGDIAHFNLDIGGRVVNGRISFASLK